MDLATQFVMPALVGVFVGIASGLLGIGGGTIMVPLFRLAFGMSPVMSTATSLFTIIPTSLSGAVSHARNRTCILKLGIALGLGGAVMSPIGAWLAHISPGWAIILAAAIVIGYSSINMFRKAFKTPKGAPRSKAEQKAKGEAAVAAGAPACEPGGSASGASATAAGRIAAVAEKPHPSLHDDDAPRVKFTLTRKQLAIGVAIGLVAGILSGYVGVGGGFIMVPLMLSILGVPMRLASGTSLIAVVILAIPGTIEQGLLGNIDFLAGVIVAVGSIPGAVLGARLVTVTPERTLRFVFGAFLLVAAALLMYNEFTAGA